MPSVLIADLPGTGKSTLAIALTSYSNGHVVSKDWIRLAIFGPTKTASQLNRTSSSKK